MHGKEQFGCIAADGRRAEEAVMGLGWSFAAGALLLGFEVAEGMRCEQHVCRESWALRNAWKRGKWPSGLWLYCFFARRPCVALLFFLQSQAR